jgi:hypothetical protein
LLVVETRTVAVGRHCREEKPCVLAAQRYLEQVSGCFGGQTRCEDEWFDQAAVGVVGHPGLNDGVVFGCNRPLCVSDFGEQADPWSNEFFGA